jgi:hypothetical protein
MKVNNKYEIKVYRKARNMEHEHRLRSRLGIEKEVAGRVLAD